MTDIKNAINGFIPKGLPTWNTQFDQQKSFGIKKLLADRTVVDVKCLVLFGGAHVTYV